MIPRADIPCDAAPAVATLTTADSHPAAELVFQLETPDIRMATVRARFAKLRDSAPRLPHTYPYAAFKENTEWLGKFTRPRPTEVRFTADHPDHLTAHGATFLISQADRHRAVRGNDETLPRFHLRNEGKTLRLDYSDADADAIEFDPAALGLPAEAQYVINGQPVVRAPGEPAHPLRHLAKNRNP